MPTPAEQFESDFFSVKTDIGWLQDSVRLKNIRDAVEDLQTTVNGMTQRISSLRERGYVFEKDLENQAKGFVTQWNALHPTVTTQINQQSLSLQAALRPLETQLNQAGALKANPMAARNLFNSLQTGISTLKDKVSAAERTIGGMYNTFQGQVNTVNSHLSDIDWMLTQLAEATFKLLPTEAGIMAVKAVYCPDVKEKPEDPDGVLYLTDQRLIFEQKEEVATKKILFIATEKKKVQEIEWEIPIALLEEIKTSKQGMMKNEDHLDLRFGPGASKQTIHLHIWQPVETWQALLNKAKTKEFDKTRAIAIDQAEVDKVKSVPAQCPGCGANMPQVVLRGQDTVKCEYCGYVVRL
jgi:predicted  nucleic acid-binding Zn-ribbon protein